MSDDDSLVTLHYDFGCNTLVTSHFLGCGQDQRFDSNIRSC